MLAGIVQNFPESLKKAIVNIVISNYDQVYKFLYIMGFASKCQSDQV